MKRVDLTQLKYDGVYREDNGDLIEGFISTKDKKFEFKQQKKSDFQDEEDLDNELSHLTLVSNFKNICEALDLELESFEKTESNEKDKTQAVVTKKSKKKKIKLNYNEQIDNEINEDEDGEILPNFTINLKRINSNMKFQKNINKNDPVYTNLIKYETLLSSNPKIPTVPNDFISKYKLIHTDSSKLSSKTASILLKSRFTNSNSTPSIPKKPKTKRTITPITVHPLIKTRLNIP